MEHGSEVTDLIADVFDYLRTEDAFVYTPDGVAVEYSELTIRIAGVMALLGFSSPELDDVLAQA